VGDKTGAKSYEGTGVRGCDTCTAGLDDVARLHDHFKALTRVKSSGERGVVEVQASRGLEDGTDMADHSAPGVVPMSGHARLCCVCLRGGHGRLPRPSTSLGGHQVVNEAGCGAQTMSPVLPYRFSWAHGAVSPGCPNLIPNLPNSFQPVILPACMPGLVED
jgi:hypothetical protein